MKYLKIDDFGKYLIIRKKDIDKDKFFEAIKCKETEFDSLQNCLCRLFCSKGISLDEMYSKFQSSYPKSSFNLNQFVAWYFRLNQNVIDCFLNFKKKDEECYFVDNVLINGYGENFILGKDYASEDFDPDKFQMIFEEAIKEL